MGSNPRQGTGQGTAGAGPTTGTGVNAALSGRPQTQQQMSQLAAGLPGDPKLRFFTDPASLPATGGLVKPTVGPTGGAGGTPMQGAGLNWAMPQAQPRTQLATAMAERHGHPMTRAQKDEYRMHRYGFDSRGPGSQR